MRAEIDQDAPGNVAPGNGGPVKTATTPTPKTKPAKKLDSLAELAKKLAAGEELTDEEKAFLKEHDAGKWTTTLRGIAQHFGVDEAAVRKWRRASPETFYLDNRGRYNLTKIEAWRREYLHTAKNPRVLEWDTDDAGATGEGKGLTLPELKVERERATVIKTWLQIDILRARYADVEVVKSQVQGVFIRLKARIKRLPREMCYAVTGIEPAQAEQLLDGETDNILNDLVLAIAGMEKELESPAPEETGNRDLQHSPRAEITKRERPY